MKDLKAGIFFVMGVSGCGKSTIGTLLAKTLEIPFYDGDNYHPPANIKKMSKGNPLNDEDRYGWLLRLNELAKSASQTGAVIACSALKSDYRDLLSQGLIAQVYWIFLKGTFPEVRRRMAARKGHFMPEELLRSQFETLEPPKDAITVSIRHSPEEIVQMIVRTTEGA